MIDKIKSNITSSFLEFVFSYADPSAISRDAIAKALEFPIEDLFSTQKKADSAKRLGRETFSKAVSLYFSGFQNQDGVDYKRLGVELIKHKKVLMRHLGKDRLAYLNLIVSVLSATPEVQVKKGLLFIVEAR